MVDIPNAKELDRRLEIYAKGNQHLKTRSQLTNAARTSSSYAEGKKSGGQRLNGPRFGTARVNVADAEHDEALPFWDFQDDLAPSDSDDEREEDGEACVAQSGVESFSLGDIPVCKRCSRGRHLEKDCALNKTCPYCRRTGHTQEMCYFVCKTCMTVHRVGECPYRLYLDKLANWVKTQKEVPSELKSMLDRLNI